MPPEPSANKPKLSPKKAAVTGLAMTSRDVVTPQDACEHLSKTRLAVYTGPTATPGEAGVLYDRTGASLMALTLNGVRLAPRFSRKNGRPLPLPMQPGHELLACYAELTKAPELRPEMGFDIRLGGAAPPSVATEPPAPTPTLKKRFETCLVDAAQQLAGADVEQGPVSISGRFLPPDGQQLKAPKVPRAEALLELEARAASKELRRGGSVVVRVAVRNRGKKDLAYVRANCERATLLEFSAPGLVYGGKVSPCTSRWERKVTIKPGRETVDTIRVKAEATAEPGLRRFQIFRRLGEAPTSPIVCSKPITLKVKP